MDDDIRGDVVKATCPKHLSLAKVIGFHVVVTKKKSCKGNGKITGRKYSTVLIFVINWDC
jgi:hypothetical protein